MRKIGLLLIAVMMILPAMAQVSFGVRAGGAYSSLIQKVEDTYEAGARFGFSIAGLADIPLSKNKKWSLRPEVAFVNQGGAYYSNQDIHGMALHNKCWYYSLQIPWMWLIRLPSRTFICPYSPVLPLIGPCLAR